MSVAKATEAVASSSISHESVSLHWAPPGLQSNLDILEPDEVPLFPHLEPVARLSVPAGLSVLDYRLLFCALMDLQEHI